MKKRLTLRGLTALLMLAGLWIGASVDSVAQSWTFDVKTAGNGGTTHWTSGVGVFASGGGFSSILNQDEGGNPFTYVTPTHVFYGEMFTNNFGGTGLESLNGAGDFAFTLTNASNLVSRDFFVTGTISGMVGIVGGIPRSNANWNLTGLIATSGSGEVIVNTLAVLPDTLIPAWKMITVVGGRPVAMWVITQWFIPSPGRSFPILGYIADATLVSISGAVFLQSVANPAQSLDLTFHPSNGSDFTRRVTLNSNGAYSVNNLPADTYRVSIKGAKWLRKNITVNASSGNVSDANAALLAGDANDDNFVDIDDLLLLIGAYNKVSPNAGYSEAADFNCDDVNDITDLLLLIGNYNKQGD